MATRKPDLLNIDHIWKFCSHFMQENWLQPWHWPLLADRYRVSDNVVTAPNLYRQWKRTPPVIKSPLDPLYQPHQTGQGISPYRAIDSYQISRRNPNSNVHLSSPPNTPKTGSRTRLDTTLPDHTFRRSRKMFPAF